MRSGVQGRHLLAQGTCAKRVRFDGDGSVHRIEGNEIVVDDRLFLLASPLAVHS
jgi:hypothetical protein